MSIVNVVRSQNAVVHDAQSANLAARGMSGTRDRPQEMLLEKSHKRAISTGYMRLNVSLALNEP